LSKLREILGSKVAATFKSRNKKITEREHLLIGFILPMYSIILFWPGLRHPMFWSDDWGYFWNNSTSEKNIGTDGIAAGRPILGWVTQKAYAIPFFTDNLLVLHLIALSGLILLQFAIYKKMRSHNFNFILSLTSVLAIGLVPGFQEYIYFISCFSYSWACLIGFLSFFLINASQWSYRILGITALVVALLIYPAGAMFYFVGLVIRLLESFDYEYSLLKITQCVITTSLKFAPPFIISFSIALMIQNLKGIHVASRIQYLKDIGALIVKLKWVATRLFVSEFRIFTVSSPTQTQAFIEFAIVFCIIVVGLLIPLKKNSIARVLTIGLILIIPLLGAAPNLIIQENQFEFRTLTSMYVMALLIWFYSISRLLGSVKSHRFILRNLLLKERILLAIGGVILIMLTIQTQSDSKAIWVDPSMNRDLITIENLDRVKDDSIVGICMIIPSEIYIPSKKLGIYSMKSDLVSEWVPEPYIRTMLFRRGSNFTGNVQVTKAQSECRRHFLVINYGPLLNLKGDSA